MFHFIVGPLIPHNSLFSPNFYLFQSYLLAGIMKINFWIP